jgi:ATP-binding cassette, subfamily C, bacterial
MMQDRRSLLHAALMRVPLAQLLSVLALMVAAALTEGLGILLLIPLLADLEGSSAAGRSLLGLGLLVLPAALELRLALFVLLIALRALLMHGLTAARGRLQLEFVDGLRRECHDAMARAEWRWLASKRIADRNAALLTNGATAGVGLDQAIGLLASAISLLVLLGLSLLLSWQATLVAALCGGLILLVLHRLRRAAFTGGEAIGAAQRALYRQFEQGLAGLRDVKMHSAEVQLADDFDRAMAELRLAKLSNQHSSALAAALIQPLGAAALALIAYVGLRHAGLSLAALIPQLLVIARIFPAVERIQQGWAQVLHALPAYAELTGLTQEGRRHAEPLAGTEAAPALTQALALDMVTVAYADRAQPALDRAVLTIAAGTTIALVGPSGAGKSTLADVIAGLIVPDHGALTIDGVALQPGQRAAWRERVAYVEQAPVFSHGTIRDNLTRALHFVSDAELKTALASASADFVFGLPQGLATEVGDAALRLSGGERQRLALARGLLQRPQVLILDEATSALDQQNEAAVVAAVRNLRGTLTIILISHRPALLDLADHIYRVDAGKIGPFAP